MKYKVKLAYGPEFFFDNIEDAGTFFDQAIRHSGSNLKWPSIEPVYPEPDETEEVDDD